MSSVSHESTGRYKFFTVCGLSACQRINSILLVYTVVFFLAFLVRTFTCQRDFLIKQHSKKEYT